MLFFSAVSSVKYVRRHQSRVSELLSEGPRLFPSSSSTAWKACCECQSFSSDSVGDDQCRDQFNETGLLRECFGKIHPPASVGDWTDKDVWERHAKRSNKCWQACTMPAVCRWIGFKTFIARCLWPGFFLAIIWDIEDSVRPTPQ